MSISNNVIFKGNKSGINIVLNKDCDFDLIKSELSKKLTEATGFFGSSKMKVNFSNRELNENEENELIDIISKSSNITISYLENDSNAKIEIKKKQIANSELKIDLNPYENNTIFHKGSLRSGQSVKHNGSVVLIGDVNPGAQIIASGNIVIIGSLKGFVHAGCEGSDKCFITAQNMIPTQLRISDVITYIPDYMAKQNKNIPSIAFIEDGQIHILETRS